MNTFNWNQTKQLTVGKFLLATFLPSAFAFTGFHALLPILVNRGVSVLAAYSIIASSMLFLFCVLALVFIAKEAGELNISVRERLCLIKLTGKQSLLAILITIGIMILSIAAGPLSSWLVNTLGIEIPRYLPFFLDPRINPATADPMVLSSGIDVTGRWGIFLLLSLTLILNILAEEIYFRAWMLPKLSKYGKWSWVINGCFFAFYHTFQIWLLPVLLVASLGFAFMNYKMKSIVPSVIAHFIINALNVVALLPLFMGQV